MNRNRFGIVLFLALALVTALYAEEKAPAKKGRLRPEGIFGSMMLCGDSIPAAALDRFIELAGNEKAKIVLVIPGKKADAKTVEKIAEPWKTKKVASLQIVTGEFDNPKALELLKAATGVWLFDFVPDFGSEELQDVQTRGGALGISGKTATRALVHTAFLHNSPNDPPADPMSLVKISDGAALIIRGRQMSIVGAGSVTIRLPKRGTRPEHVVEITAKEPTDLTMLRRAALERGAGSFPPKIAPVPEVEKGALVIVGGGGMPADVTKKFIDLAGGPDALIVVLPTAQPEPLPFGGANEGAFLKKAGAKNVVTINARTREAVEDPKNLELLKKAGGVWFGGGRQWRFVDTYENTLMEDAFHEVLRRGGVIGGSSAGASIQGHYMCRGSPLGNLEIMCEGYERGLGFLPGTAIDQHFAQRKRFADMTELMKTYPQLLGIGLDEATALVVHGHVADVMGKGQAHFYDRKKPVEKDKPDHDSIGAGGRYDLKERKNLPADRK